MRSLATNFSSVTMGSLAVDSRVGGGGACCATSGRLGMKVEATIKDARASFCIAEWCSCLRLRCGRTVGVSDLAALVPRPGMKGRMNSFPRGVRL